MSTETPPTELHFCCDDFPDCECGEEDIVAGWQPINHESEAQEKLEVALGDIKTLQNLISVITGEKENLTKKNKKLNNLVAHYNRLINNPETQDFLKGVRLESAHQIERWGNDRDRGKDLFDWVFLIGHLATRAAAYYESGDHEKGRHHCITTAAVCNNWHRYMSGDQKDFLPGLNVKKYFKFEE